MIREEAEGNERICTSWVMEALNLPQEQQITELCLRMTTRECFPETELEQYYGSFCEYHGGPRNKSKNGTITQVIIFNPDRG